MKVIKLTKTTLHADVLARYFSNVELISATRLTKIRVTFPHGQITRALLRVALSLTSAARESILTFAAALTEFFAKILRLYTGT